MSEWIKWNGGKCPVHPRTVVLVQLRRETMEKAIQDNFKYQAKSFRWLNNNDSEDIVAYRVIQEYQPTIAETIREAAINWPAFLGDVECGVLDAFSNLDDAGYTYEWYASIFVNDDDMSAYQSRTFMLFVAEALE